MNRELGLTLIRMVALAIIAWAPGSGAVIAAAPPQLRYVVIITRHGVRSPTWPLERLAPYAAEPWPDWGVPPGYLTPHGRALMLILGNYYREWLTAEHVLSPSGCGDAGRVYIHADIEQRTLETGRALAESLLPGCAIPIHSVPEGTRDPLFDPVAAGVDKPDANLAAQAVRERMASDPKRFVEPHRAAFEALERVLAGAGTPQKRIEPPQELTVSSTAKDFRIDESSSIASTLSEDLLLEYTDGMRGKDLGWGRLDESTLLRILELHATNSDLTRRTPYLARARGSNLLERVRQSIEQAESGHAATGALGPLQTRVLIIVGHDTNISNLSGMLDLSWHLSGYPPEETPPGGALIFSLWRSADAPQFFVRAQYLAQSLDQMRDATRLTLAVPPEKEDVSPNGCPPAAKTPGCPWDAFENSLLHAVDPHFIAAQMPAP